MPNFNYDQVAQNTEGLDKLFRSPSTGFAARPSQLEAVSVNGKIYSIQELVTQAEAFQYLLKTPSKLEVFSNTAHFNFIHHLGSCVPMPELTESTMVSMAKIHGIERGTPEYTLLYILQEYFSGVVANKQKAEAPRERQPTPSSNP